MMSKAKANELFLFPPSTIDSMHLWSLLPCLEHNFTLIVHDSRKLIGGLELEHQGSSKTSNTRHLAIISASSSVIIQQDIFRRPFLCQFRLEYQINTATNFQAIIVSLAKYPTNVNHFEPSCVANHRHLISECAHGKQLKS